MAKNAYKYFAAAPPDKIGKSLSEKISSLSVPVGRDHQRKAIGDYFSEDRGQGSSVRVKRKGERGEYTSFRVPQARSLLKAYLSMVMSAKLSWRAQAENGSANAAQAVVLAQAVCESLWTNQGLAQVMYEWAERTMVCSRAYLFPEWDRGRGKVSSSAMDEDGAPIYEQEGDFSWHVLSPSDVFEDPALRSHRDSQWCFLRIAKNRSDLMKLFPVTVTGDATEDKLSAMSGYESIMENTWRRTGVKNDDLVPVWYFFHRPSPSLPQGLRCTFVNGSCVLELGPLGDDSGGGYRELPAFRFSADEVFDSNESWSSFWDLLSSADISDDITKNIASVITTMGKTFISAELGSYEKPDQFAKGLRIIPRQKGSAPPIGVNTAVIPPVIMAYKDSIDGKMPSILGLNDVALGRPDTAQMNAQAFAVLASMAVQQASPFQQKMIGLVGRVGTFAIRTFVDKVQDDRLLELVGPDKEGLIARTHWNGSELKPISSISVGIGNPMEQTPAGRYAVLQLMLSANLITSPDQVQQVIETGRLEPVIDPMRDEQHLLRREKESILRGENPPVHALHNHVMHYQSNAAAIWAALDNPAVLQAGHEHLDAHYLEYWGVPSVDPMTGMADPELLMRRRFMMGQGPEPMPMPLAPGAPPPGEGPPGMAPPPPAGGPPQPMPSGGGVPGRKPSKPPPTSGEVLSASSEGPMVSAPTNPFTGDKFQP